MNPVDDKRAAETSPVASDRPLEINSRRTAGGSGPGNLGAAGGAAMDALQKMQALYASNPRAAAALEAIAQRKAQRRQQKAEEPQRDADEHRRESERLFPPGEDDVFGSLSERQLQAVELIVSGHGDEDVGAELRVHRVTITRWRLYHVSFRAALARRRQEVWGSSADRFRSLLARAVDVVEQGLQSDDPQQQVRAARTVLGLASRGRFCPPREPQTTPEVLDELARAHRQQRLASDAADQTLEPEDYEAAAMELGRRHVAFREKEERLGLQSGESIEGATE